MKKLTKKQLKLMKIKVGVIRGIYKASKDRLIADNKISAGELRRYNGYLNKIKEITNDSEFINFSVSIMTAWSNNYMVSGTEFNSRSNQFFEYIKHAYNLDENKKNPNMIRNLLNNISVSRIVTGVIVGVILLLITLTVNYLLGIEKNPEPQPNQSHSGSGDNVAGDKNVTVVFKNGKLEDEESTSDGMPNSKESRFQQVSLEGDLSINNVLINTTFGKVFLGILSPNIWTIIGSCEVFEDNSQKCIIPLSLKFDDTIQQPCYSIDYIEGERIMVNRLDC